MANSNSSGTGEPVIERLALTFFDAAQLSTAIREASLEHYQLDVGDFRGELHGLLAGPIVLNSGCYNRTLRARGCLPDDAVVVGAILMAECDGCINGYRFGAKDLICYPAGAELDYLLPAHTHWAGLQIPRTVLGELGLSESLFREPKVFSASLPGCARIVSRLARLAGARPSTTVTDWHAELAALAAELMLMAHHGDAPGGRASYAERMRLLRAFEHLVRERIGEDVRIPPLCRAIGVAQRTLEQAFRDQLGISPRRYLTILRLHAARDALLRGADVDIAGLAARCGMHHPGRFASEYRALFGESPSATDRTNA
ncbi:MAG: helix-turn-helix domain-containing protein [Thiohalocapsa sp.]|jgi:AraC family ethanolamine operon transcriptional activator|uniref:helix-turn-helix domain-containing protein n=1 Tax=Thiohalocapsa sp. TaxID=2497641 RepID=UPI0025D41763|nr:helix-turn-helix domain-containing protein [Thiohalocapsa sp.]